jgi:hypothetical protein
MFEEAVDLCVCKDLGDGFFSLTLYMKESAEMDVMREISRMLPDPLLLEETVFYLFREQPVPKSLSRLQVHAFDAMLLMGRGNLEELLGPRIMDRSLQLVRRIPV